MKKLSIVLPVFNESNTIQEIVAKVQASMLANQTIIQDHEIIIVDDGSTDGTREILQQYVSKDQRIKVLFHQKNMGKGAALASAFAETKGDIVIIQDADLEYDPKEYPVLLQPFIDGKADVVFGSRFKGNVGRVLYFWHYVGNVLLTLLSNMFTNLNLSDMETCYKVFRGDVIRNMVLKSKRFGIEPEMTAKVAKIKGIRIYEVPISYYGRTYEEGKKISWVDGVSALWCIVRFNLLTSYRKSFRK